MSIIMKNWYQGNSRNSATAEKHSISFLGWLRNWSCNSRNTADSAIACISAVQGHPRWTILILVPTESAYMILLVCNSNLGLILVLSCTVSEIQRLTGWKVQIFPPHSHSASPLSTFHLEFHSEVNHEETRVMVLSSSEDPMILAWVVLTQCQTVTDRRTDRQTDLL